MKIILVRHGETSWNKEQIFRGRKDIKLNRNGIIQAKRLGKYFANIRIDTIYSSPLNRALFTAKEIAKHHNLKVKISKELIDFNFGSWEGHTHEEIKKKYPQLYKLWRSKPEKLKIPKGEAVSRLRKRLKGFLNDLTKKSFNQTIILVSHRVVLKMLILIALGIGADYFWLIKLDTGSVSILEYLPERKFILTNLNNTGHLRKYQEQIDF